MGERKEAGQMANPHDCFELPWYNPERTAFPVCSFREMRIPKKQFTVRSVQVQECTNVCNESCQKPTETFIALFFLQGIIDQSWTLP